MNKNETALNTLKNIIGESLFVEVCDKMAGERVSIPVYGCGFVTTEERNRSIRRDFYKGLSISELTTKYDLQSSTIYKIIASRGNPRLL